MARKYILIIDDSQELQGMLKDFFESEGYIVGTAFNGEEALAKLKSLDKQPNIILLDIMMPVMDGFEFLQEKSKLTPLSTSPVVVMTGGMFTKDEENLLRASSKKFLKKPLDLDELDSTVKQYQTV